MTARNIYVYENGKKIRNTASETIDFLSIKVGATALEIKESGSYAGHFDLGSKRLTAVADPVNDQDAATKKYTTDTFIPLTQKGAANGVATLDASSKIPVAQLPNSVMEYKGAWNATTNVPVLADGGAALYAAKIIQDLTYTAVAAGVAGNSITIEYTTGGTAGSEVVTVIGNAISVQIADNISTATQIKTAVDLVSAATDLIGVTVSGTGSNAQTAVSATNLTGGQEAANAGDVYRASVAGTQDLGSGSNSYGIGDFVIYSGSIWQKSPATDAVISVNGLTGAVTLYTDNISEDGSPLNLWFTDARAKAAAVVNTLAGSETDQAPSVSAVNTALALKADLSSEYETLVNDNAGTITVGQIVYVKPNGHVDLAKADALATCSTKLGVVLDATILTTASGKIHMLEGKPLALYTALTIGVMYYLSAATSGAITATAPSTITQCIVPLGKTSTAEKLVFNPEEVLEILS